MPDFDVGLQERIDEVRRGRAVVLPRRNDVCPDLALCAPLGLPARLVRHVLQHGHPVASSHVLDRSGRNHLLPNDVAHAPPAAFPEVRDVRLCLVLRPATGSAAELIRMHVQRRRESGAGRLGEHAGDVVEGRDPVPAEVAPARILTSVQNAADPGFLQLVGDVGAVPRQLPPLQRIRAGPDRLAVGRHVHAGAVRAHLVVVDVRLRLPLAVHHLGEILGLRQVEEIAIAVVIVPGVHVVEKRQPTAFVLRADRFPVPVRDHELTVGIDVREQQHDGLVEDALRFFVVARQHVVGNRRSGLSSRNLGRMET